MRVDRPERACERLPRPAVAKRSGTGRSPAALFVVAQNGVRAVVVPPATSIQASPAPIAHLFVASTSNTLRRTHHGVAAAYLSSYVRGVVFAHNRDAPMRSAVLRLARSPHRSGARVRALGRRPPFDAAT